MVLEAERHGCVREVLVITSALSTASILPAFLFVLLVQRHLVRGLTMGLTKG